MNPLFFFRNDVIVFYFLINNLNTFFSYFESLIILLCSWDKSLNIGSRMLRIYLKVHSFTFDHLNCMQPIVWYMKCIMTLSWDHIMQESISGKWYLADWDTFQDNPLFLNPFCSLIITDTKLHNPKYHKKNKGRLPNDQYIEGVASDLLHTVQTVKCKGVNFEENSQHAASNIQALISTTQ